MAKTETTVKGYVYTVTSPNGGTVTDAEGKLNKTVDAGDQLTVQAPSDSLTCSDDDAVIYKTNFKNPLLALRLLGQGETALPAGYTMLEFLQSTGTQYINTGVRLNEGFVLKCEFVPTQVVGHGCLFGARLAVNTVHCMRNNTSGTYGVPVISNGGAYNMNIPFDLNESYSLELNDMGKKIVVNGKETSGLDFYSVPELDFYIFCENFPREGNLANGVRAVFFDAIRFMSFELSNAGRRHNLVPALDPTGTPCMFDTVSKQPFKNAGSGQFVAGVGSVAQLTALLRNLPATGGALTLSLPAEANTPEVAESLQACHDTKGWTLTVHEYRHAAASTYSLRRVRDVAWCRRELSDLGSYVDADGFRWQIDRCAAIFGALGQDPAAYGYTPFDSVEQAAEYWELQPYVDPNAEGLTNEI